MVEVNINKIYLVAAVIVILIALVGVNQYIISTMSSNLGAQITGSAATPQAQSPTQTQKSPTQTQNIPQGKTDYDIAFNDNGFYTLVEYSKLDLTSDQLQRFIRIGTLPKTACEACCGIGTGPAVNSNGNANCGCGHNFALIGLMKHLVKNYGDRYTDQQILDEVAKWKVFFFPQLAGGSAQQRGGC